MAVKTRASESGHSRAPGMSERDYRRFSEFVHRECGIKLPPSKKTMVEARLQKRLRQLALADYKEYCEYLFSAEGMSNELEQLINVVTTNTTSFFREPKHFEYLNNTVLPDWLQSFGGRRQLSLWSAGCSAGMEPYTLAIVLSEFSEKHPEFRFSILATDISSRVLETAVQGIYNSEQINTVSHQLKQKYFLRSKDRKKKLVRVVPELRSRVRFRRLNFMQEFDFREKLDIIFCRNVLIYFDRPTQEVLLNKFCRHLRPGGHLFIGHSESLAGMNLPLEQVAPTIYRRR
jgi:chemotaxis protein methyltransferase CheR